MALTLAELWGHLRRGDGVTEPEEPIRSVLVLAHSTAVEFIEVYAPDAPAHTRDQATVRMAGWLYDSDPLGRIGMTPNAAMQCGAAPLLDPWRVVRAIPVRRNGSQPSPTPSGPGLTIDQIEALLRADEIWTLQSVYREFVTANDRRIAALEREIASGQISADDEVARAAAEAAAQAAAAARQVADRADTAAGEAKTAADTAQTTADGAKTVADRADVRSTSNAAAIAKNLGDITTERGRINTLDDLVRANRGSISIAPDNIPTAAAVQREYKFAHEDLDVDWLRSKRVNSMEVWIKNTAFHSVDPWAPAQDGTYDVAVNAQEALAIGLTAGDRIVPVRLVWRASGTFVALRNTWLSIGGIAADLATEVAARTSGDEIQPESITSAAGLTSFLRDQETSAQVAIAHFTIDVREVYQGVDHVYKTGDLVWFPPMSVDGKVFANIAAAPVPELPTADKIEMLNLRVDPGVIAYPAGGLAAALTRTVRAVIDNPGRLDDEGLFVQGTIDGQAVLARRAWTTATVSLPYVIPLATARLIGQDEELDLVLQWYDAANAGNLVGSRRVDLPLVEQMAVVELANEAAYNALAAKNSRTFYYVAQT